MSPIKSSYAQVNGTQLYYEVAGEGEPLILIHGGQLDRRMWDDQFAAFSTHYQVIRYDVRDYGLSTCPPGTYSNHEDLYGLLKHLNMHSAYLVGLSLGGAIAIDFALTYPDMVHALILASSGLSGYSFNIDVLPIDESRGFCFNEISL